jgi:hypothetical protein
MRTSGPPPTGGAEALPRRAVPPAPLPVPARIAMTGRPRGFCGPEAPPHLARGLTLFLGTAIFIALTQFFWHPIP